MRYFRKCKTKSSSSVKPYCHYSLIPKVQRNRFDCAAGRHFFSNRTCRSFLTILMGVCQSLLDFKNTPTQGMMVSPAQRFLGRRTRTPFPIHSTKLEPDFPVYGKQLQEQRQHVMSFYRLPRARAASSSLTRRTASSTICILSYLMTPNALPF